MAEEKQELSLAELSDQQKVLLSSIAYLDFTEEGLELIKNGGLRLADAGPYLAQADIKASGDFPVGDPQTDKDLWKNLVDVAGFGDLVIVDATSHSSTGFQALTFEDQAGNTGITYRGSDFDFEQGGHKDWLKGNALEHFIGQSEHAEAAVQYFEDHCNTNGKNFIYGYSLGGNQVQHAFCEHYDLIEEAFSFNGNSISPALIDTPEKLAAFNSDKFNCCIIEGDIIGMSKQNELYKNNVRVIKNSGEITTNFMNAHGQAAASYDEHGNFITIPYEQMIQNVKNVYEKAEVGIEFEVFGKKFDIDWGPDNMWELVGLIQQAGVKSSQIHENVRDAVDKLPEPIKDATAYIASAMDLPILGIITNPKESMAEYQAFLDRTGQLAQKYLPSVDDLERMQIFGAPARFFKKGAEWFVDQAGDIYKDVTDGTKTLIKFASNCIIAPSETANQITESAAQWKGMASGEWIRNLMDKTGLTPVLKNEKVVETIDDLKQWGQETKEWFAEKAQDAPEWLSNVWEQGIENSWLAQKVAQHVDLDKICGEAKESIEKIKEIDVKEIGEEIGEFFQDGYEKAKDGIGQAGSYVSQQAGKFGDFVEEKWDQAGDAIENFLEEDLGIKLPWE